MFLCQRCGDFYQDMYKYIHRLPVTLDAISGEGSVRLEEDGVLRARVVHRAAFQTHLMRDGSRGRL